MSTKTDLVNELSRLTGEQKKTFKSLSKEELIILLHETRKRKNRPTYGKHVWLSTPPKRRKSRRRSRGSPKRSKHVWLVSPRSRPRRKRKSPKRRRSKSRSRRASPKRRRSRRRSRKRSRRRSSLRRRKRNGVSFGGKHVLFGTPKRRRSSRRRSRGILKAKRSYRSKISYSPRRTKRQILAAANRRSPSPKRRISRSRSPRRSRSPTKKSYVDELARLTGRTKSYYNSWSKHELKQRLYATEEEHWSPKHGKHVWLSTPPKRRKSRKRSRKRSRKKRSKKKVPCKTHQERNERGRCVNKPCKPGKIRDKVTKRCRKKKN